MRVSGDLSVSGRDSEPWMVSDKAIFSTVNGAYCVRGGKHSNQVPAAISATKSSGPPKTDK
jgi:hypothetical protein